MSTRWYPLYQRGGPQLRIYLPNFWMKLVRPSIEQPQNVVQFSCSIEMTKHDIKSYLEKIYGVKTVSIRTRIAMGKTKPHAGQGYVIKEDDEKYAYVTLPKGENFQFPDLFTTQDESKNDQEKALKETKEGYQRFLDKNKNRPNMPGWFTI